MSNLNLEQVDLIAIQRAAPRNGAPSSEDYNDNAREVLRDLVSITEFLNEQLIPILAALPEAAQDGLTGATVFANPSETTNAVFFNEQEARPYTVAEVMKNLVSSNVAALQKINDLSAKVAKLQTLLATTGQTDIIASVQSFADQIRNLGAMLNTVKGSLVSYEARFQQTKAVRLEIPSAETHTTQEIDVSWDIPYHSNDYTAVLSIEDPTGGLEVAGWSKLSNGRGVHVTVYNASNGTVDNAILHMIGQADAAAAA
jgi:hypothetical protein